MSEQVIGLPEAPVSWTVRYASTQGYDCMLTLRGMDAAAVLKEAAQLLGKMAEAGARPSGNGNGHSKPQGDAAPAEQAPTCPTHGEPMKPSKFGGWYCGVKIAEDGGDGKPVYCKQKVK